MTDSKFSFHRYEKLFETEWETFLALNGCFTFQFQRKFIDFYSNTQNDVSYLVRDSSGELLGIIALEEIKQIKQIISHPKSTFGGVFYKMGTTLKVREIIFSEFMNELRNTFSDYTCEIRTSPRSFNPSESAQERWILWRFGFNIKQVVLHSIIDLNEELKQDTKRIKFRNRDIKILETKSHRLLKSYWALLQDNLSRRHNAQPTHDLPQIEQLLDIFPNEIRMFVALDISNQVLGGLIFFNALNVFHLQYMAVSNIGRKLSVGDLLIIHSLEVAKSEGADFFNFGHSHENYGYLLNYDLYSYKSKFGSKFDEAIRWSIELKKSPSEENNF